MAALAAACDSSSSKPLRVVAVTTEALTAGDQPRAAYCRYTNGVLDKDAPAEVGGRAICPPNPADFQAARMAPKGVRLRVVFDRELRTTTLARRDIVALEGETPATLTCGSKAVTATFDYQPDDPFGPTIIIVPDFATARVPTSASCKLEIDNGITDTSGVRIEADSAFDLRVVDLSLLSISPVNDTDTVLAPTGAVQFVFNAPLDETTVDDLDFQITLGGADVPIDFDILPGMTDAEAVYVFGEDVFEPGAYMARVRSSAQFAEVNGGSFVFDPAGPNTFAFTVTDVVMTGLDVTTADPSVPLGVPVQFSAIATLSDGTTSDVTSMATWSANPTSVATISNAMGTRGQLTSVDDGNVTVSATLGAFTDTFSLTIEPAALVSIEVSPATAMIPDGRTQQFTALGNYTDGTALDVTSTAVWSTSAPTIASIGPTGLATTVGNTAIGPTTITATQGSVSDTALLTVTMAVVESIIVTCDDDELSLGLTLDCQAQGLFSDGTSADITNTATWTATPAGRLAVSASGVASTPSGATAGPASVTATVGSISDSFDITVTAATLQSITITEPDGWDIPIGTDLQFFASGTYSNGAVLDVTNTATWTATPAGRITITAGGLASAPSSATTGSATVTATIGAISDSSMGSVAPAVLESIVVTPDNITRAVGTTQQYTATGTFSDGGQLDITNSVTWSTSNGAFATVSSTGLATMVAPGSVSVIATSGLVTDSASLVVQSSAPEMGIAISAQPIPDPGVDAAGNRVVGVPFSRTYTITNAGNANLTIGAITFPSPTNCTASVQTPPGMTTVGPSSSTTFTVTITPTNRGTFSCPVAVANNDADENPYNVDVRGLGVLDTGNFANADGIYDGDNGCGMGTFTLSSDDAIVLANLAGNGPLLFLLQAAATASASGVVVFAIGNHTCTITRIGTSFTMSMSCSNTSGGSCSESFSRRMAPEITVQEVATGDEQFSGRGESYALLPSAVNFVDWEFRIRNDGTAPLTLGTLTFTNDINCNGAIQGTPPAATLAPGASTTVTIRATPVANGPFLCSVAIPNNDSDENPFVIRIAGEAF